MDQYGAGASPCRSCSPTMKAAPPPPRRARVADAERRALGLRGGRAEGIDWSLEPWSGGPWASHLVGLAIRLCLSLGRCLPSMLDARERAVGNRRPARRGAAGALEDYRRRQGCSGATTAVTGAAAPPCGMGSSASARVPHLPSPQPWRCIVYYGRGSGPVWVQGRRNDGRPRCQ